jgi:uncharacterized protein (DUF1330 family)
VAENAKAFAKYGARFLARGGNSEVVEGRSYSRTVIVELKDFDAALTCYHSPEYARARELRKGRADRRRVRWAAARMNKGGLIWTGSHFAMAWYISP